MRTQLEIICSNENEVEAINQFVENNEICTVEIAIHDDRVTLNSYWLLNGRMLEAVALQAENARWMQFVNAFAKRFPSNS
jgi:hypothetical protein